MNRKEAIRVLEFDLDHTHNDESKEALRMAIKALNQQMCEDAISRKAAITETYRDCTYVKSDKDAYEQLQCIRDGINKLPSVQPKPTECEDAVSREDALMALTGEWTELTDELIHRFIRRIKNLPSVNPQPKTRHSAILKQVMWERDVAIDQLKQLGYGLGEKIRTDEDAISRQAAIDALKQAYWNKDMQNAKDDPCIVDAMTDWAIRTIKDLPSVNSQSKVGRWIRVTDKTGYLVWECDKCGWQQRFNTNFCPDCGAKMVE